MIATGVHGWSNAVWVSLWRQNTVSKFGMIINVLTATSSIKKKMKYSVQVIVR
jgi:hypothetical protein